MSTPIAALAGIFGLFEKTSLSTFGSLLWVFGLITAFCIGGLIFDLLKLRRRVSQPKGEDFFVCTWGAHRKGGEFQIELFKGGGAERRGANGRAETSGSWVYTRGEARITWKIDASGAILRLTPDGVFRFPFYNGLPDFNPDDEGSLVVRQG
jgi:hypothetical protein